MTSSFSITPRAALVDPKTGLPTRELFLLLDYLNSVATDIGTLFLIQSVTNGTTDKAPSSNAVYDADAVLAAAIAALSANLSGNYTSTTNLAPLLIEDAINDGITAKAPAQNIVFDALAAKLSLDGSTPMTGPLVAAPFTVGGVPAAGSYAGGIVYVTNESGGATIAYSNGTNWRRVYDNAIIS